MVLLDSLNPSFLGYDLWAQEDGSEKIQSLIKGTMAQPWSCVLWRENSINHEDHFNY